MALSDTTQQKKHYGLKPSVRFFAVCAKRLAQHDLSPAHLHLQVQQGWL